MAALAEANDIEAPKALDVQLRGLHTEPSESNLGLAAIVMIASIEPLYFGEK